MTYRMLVTWTATYETVCHPDEVEDIDPGEGYVVDSFVVLSTTPTTAEVPSGQLYGHIVPNKQEPDPVKVRWQAKFKTILEVELDLSLSAVSANRDAVQVAFDRTWDIEPGPGYVDDFEVLNTERLL